MSNLAGQITVLANLLNEHLSNEKRYSDLALAEKALAFKIQTEDLPEMLLEAELKKITLEDGTEATLGEVVTASITAANRPEAHRWLVDHEFGGLIKTNVSIAFPRDQQDEAKAFAAKLGKDKDCVGDVAVDESVHAGTLKAFVRERLEAGEDVPRDLFGVFVYKVVKLKAPKEK